MFLKAHSSASCRGWRWSHLTSVIFQGLSVPGFLLSIGYARKPQTPKQTVCINTAGAGQIADSEAAAPSMEAAGSALCFVLVVSSQTVSFRVLSPLIHGSVQHESFFSALLAASPQMLSRLQQLVENNKDPLLQANASDLLSAVR